MSSDDYARTRKNQASRRRFESRNLIEELKRGPCKDCGRKWHPCQMDFLRPDGGGPRMASLLGKSLERIVGEAQKRDLVCANCSRLRDWRKKRKMRMGPT